MEAELLGKNSAKILDALSESFLNIYEIDTKTKGLDIIKLDGYITSNLDKKKRGPYSYAEVCEKYIAGRVYEEDKAFVAKNMMLDNIIARTQNTPYYDFKYRVVSKDGIHYCQGRYRRMDERYIICGFQSIDSLIAEEEFRLHILEALSSDYANVFLINTVEETSEPLAITDDISARLGIGVNEKISYKESCERYLTYRLHPDDVEKIAKSMDLSTVCKKLETAKEFSDNFRIVTDGTVHYYQFKYLRVRNTDYLLCSFLNTDQLMAEERERNQELSRINSQLEDATAEQEAQIEEITALNEELEDQRTRLESAYGMIEGFTQEFHTIWVVDKITLRMRLIRTSDAGTIPSAVQIGKDNPLFDEGFAKYIDTFVVPADRKRMRKAIHSEEVLRQLEQKNVYAVNYLRQDDTGKITYHQIAFSNADTQSTKQFVYGFRDIDDITKEEQIKKQELEEAKDAAEAANAAKTSFLFNMSHDIRTPMNAILGFRDLLEKHQDDPERRANYLAKIEDASNILLSIINNVLEMARIEKGTVELDESPQDAAQFNDSLFDVFDEMMRQKGLVFTRQVEIQHQYVYYDQLKLREIFINLLSNAYKYTNVGGSVNMRLVELPSDREGYALFQTTLSDTGIGMSEEFLPHLFEEFARESNSTGNKIEGTGLGMPIVKRLVELMGGTITVDSKKGIGTTFVVTLPHRIAQKADLKVHPLVNVDYRQFRGKRILLAEDNDLNAEIADEILKEAGFIVDRAANGKIACELLDDATSDYYDAVLMDIQMPEMNGYEATKAIRAMKDPSKAGIPILAMTANAFDEDKRQAERAGMNGHVAKPIDVNELMLELAQIFEEEE